MRNGTILIVAGEVSGDIHAGNLLRELKKIDPSIDAFGVGGERLSGEGFDAVASTDDLAHMGLVEVVRELPRIRRILLDLVGEAVRRRPDVAVLVDSPDFNLRLAKRLHKLGVPVVLYVSPQLWAWRSGRVRTVRRLAEEVLCILPFEVPFYEERGVHARYVGHPLVDEIDRVGLLAGPREPVPGRLALLPGSRAMEVRQLLPVMLAALQLLPEGLVSDVVVVEAPGMKHLIGAMIDRSPADTRVRRVGGEERRQELATAALAWTASGTATLECALLGVPMVIGYRLTPVSYAVARLLVRVPNVGLANLIAGETIAPELLQNMCDPRNLAEVSADMLKGGAQAQRTGLAVVRERLGQPGASRRAAQAVADYL